MALRRALKLRSYRSFILEGLTRRRTRVSALGLSAHAEALIETIGFSYFHEQTWS
jgi:hypothetical protein